jgi:hypothetical protein
MEICAEADMDAWNRMLLCYIRLVREAFILFFTFPLGCIHPIHAFVFVRKLFASLRSREK